MTNVDNTISGTGVIGQMDTGGGLGPVVGISSTRLKVLSMPMRALRCSSQVSGLIPTLVLWKPPKPGRC